MNRFQRLTRSFPLACQGPLEFCLYIKGKTTNHGGRGMGARGERVESVSLTNIFVEGEGGGGICVSHQKWDEQ